MIRKMTLEDLDQVMEIEKQAFHDHWPRSAYEYELKENEFSTLLVYEENKQVLGIIGYYILFDEAQITTIATRSDAKRRGIARKLMDAMIQDCDEKLCCTVSLEVRKSNFPAIQLYESYEFITVNVRKGYYEDGEDAYLMIKALGGGYRDEDISN